MDVFHAERPHGLYGNSFGRARVDTVENATKVRLYPHTPSAVIWTHWLCPHHQVLSPPTSSNIIAIAALGYGRGQYTLVAMNRTPP